MKKPKIEYDMKSANISECGKFRYLLTRRWSRGPFMTFIMLNPSTADADQDDATILKCVGFAQRHGCGGIFVVNLFAFRATDPKDLKAAGFPIGEATEYGNRNDIAILSAAAASQGGVICAWGANANRTPRPAAVCKMLKEMGVQLKCLGITQDGFPLHPVMLSYDRDLIDYSPL